MSIWLDSQKKSIFPLYKRVIAMLLHFKPGSRYSYPQYNGETNIKIENFDPKPSILPWSQLRNKLKDVDVDKFLFANFLAGNIHISHLNSQQAFKVYYNWDELYGTPERFNETCKRLYWSHSSFSGCDGGHDSFFKCFDDYMDRLSVDCRDVELLIWILQNVKGAKARLREISDENVFVRSSLDHIEKVSQFYEWFCYFPEVV